MRSRPAPVGIRFSDRRRAFGLISWGVPPISSSSGPGERWIPAGRRCSTNERLFSVVAWSMPGAVNGSGASSPGARKRSDTWVFTCNLSRGFSISFVEFLPLAGAGAVCVRLRGIHVEIQEIRDASIGSGHDNSELPPRAWSRYLQEAVTTRPLAVTPSVDSEGGQQ